MKRQYRYLSSIIFSLLLTSCVSQILQEKAPTFSNEISFIDPTPDFKKMKNGIYPSWKNSKSGNVISIVSDCNEQQVISMTSLYQLILDSVEQGQAVKQEAIVFQGKPATFYVTEGFLEGQPIRVHSLALKRKNCGYLSSLSGRPDKLSLDEGSFNRFNESLKFE